MNKTQMLTWLAIAERCDGDGLLLEALLRRGFLAYADDEGTWLGTGTHPADIHILRFIDGLVLEPVEGHRFRSCRVAFRDQASDSRRRTALQVISLPENHEGNDLGHFTSVGLGHHIGGSWRSYCRMRWGGLLPVCPVHGNASKLHHTHCGALDTGVALLVKALPLARVATAYSCDGHGTQPATVAFNYYPWDNAWFGAVFSWLPWKPEATHWDWSHGLRISPLSGFDDHSLKAMLEDIQRWSCQLLAVDVIEHLGRIREKVIAEFGPSGAGPAYEIFAEAAYDLLALEERVTSAYEAPCAKRKEIQT